MKEHVCESDELRFTLLKTITSAAFNENVLQNVTKMNLNQK